MSEFWRFGLHRLERLYAVAEELRRLSPGTVSAARLAGKFEVSRRTMERDLAALRDAGLPMYASTGRTGGYGVLPHDGEILLTFTAQEITGLLMAATAAETAPYVGAARAAATRLRDALPPATRVAVDELRDRIRASVPGEQPVPARIRNTLQEAVRTGRVVNLVYVDGQGRRTTRAVDAVGFYGGGGVWYLIGWCHLRHDGRLFRLDRVERATLTRRPAQAHDVDETLGWVPDDVAAPG
jgi:predicted DNA-binding transcriptional regulator YafY